MKNFIEWKIDFELPLNKSEGSLLSQCKQFIKNFDFSKLNEDVVMNPIINMNEEHKLESVEEAP